MENISNPILFDVLGDSNLVNFLLIRRYKMTISEQIQDFTTGWHKYFQECQGKYLLEPEDEQIILDIALELITYNYVIREG